MGALEVIDKWIEISQLINQEFRREAAICDYEVGFADNLSDHWKMFSISQGREQERIRACFGYLQAKGCRSSNYR